MRRTNWRVAIVGVALIFLAAGFFIGMESIAGRSNDPAEMMRTVGLVSGAGGGVGFVMALVGFIGRRR